MPAQSNIAPLRMRGMTLIELMIVVVIVGVLAAFALPAYQSSEHKSHRAEAFTALANIQQAQERWRGSNGAYATNDQLTLMPPPADPPGLGLSATSTPKGYYALAIPNSSAIGYTVTATGQGSQATDSTCKLLAAKVSNGNLQYGSGLNAIDWTDPGRCWAR